MGDKAGRRNTGLVTLGCRSKLSRRVLMVGDETGDESSTIAASPLSWPLIYGNV